MRPKLLTLGCLVALVAAFASCGGRGNPEGTRVIVLGIDGMDYTVASRMLEEGRLPNLARLAREGSFIPLETSVPPLSPVAWSNFITGLDSGGHGVFDFFHRDPETMIPYFSTATTEEPGKMFKFGKYQISLSGGGTILLRSGQPFWEVLENGGVETTILRMPANFPPSGTATRELSGMGTPDMLGSYGTFSFYSTAVHQPKTVSGGKIFPMLLRRDIARGTIYGPDNPVLVEKRKLEAEFTIYRDPDADVAKLVVGDEELVLDAGTWTEWIPVEFDVLPLKTVGGIVRFYLRQVRPEVEIYVSPINLDPSQPESGISTPASYAGDLAEASGPFYTQGMPEDTQSLRQEVLTPLEFLEQARIAGEEIDGQFGPVLEDFEDGLLFFYIGNLDQVSHMMFRGLDPDHPAYTPEVDGPVSMAVPNVYEAADRVVGHALENMGPDTLLIVMSDHGFASARREFSLNTWLLENGYLAVKNPSLENDPGFFANFDWSGTRAYGVGFNGLYINVAGRERNGIVSASERTALMEEIEQKLLQVIDPSTGQAAVTRVYLRERDYVDRGRIEDGPDMVVGYARGTRALDASVLGGVPPEIFGDNTEWWSGDHGMDHTTVPGVLFTSRELRKPATSLKNLAAAILAEFGIDEFPAAEAGTGTEAAD
jgi:predicted AlkP superfamily phosphohydrolase/phosphomutase